MLGCGMTVAAGVVLAPMLGSGSLLVIFLFLALAQLAMGWVYGPLGAWLPGLFPARVRYTGASLAFNVGGILGGGLAPFLAQAMADRMAGSPTSASISAGPASSASLALLGLRRDALGRLNSGYVAS